MERAVRLAEPLLSEKINLSPELHRDSDVAEADRLRRWVLTRSQAGIFYRLYYPVDRKGHLPFSAATHSLRSGFNLFLFPYPGFRRFATPPPRYYLSPAGLISLAGVCPRNFSLPAARAI